MASNLPENEPHRTNLPSSRTYRVELKHCILDACDGELAEISYYERNNWVTIEYACNRCGRHFTVKIEA